MNIKLDHINISVANLQESIQWYQKLFGFEPVESGKSTSGDWAIVAHNDSMICMTELTGKRPANKWPSGENHRIYHFGIRVSDVEKWKEIMRLQHVTPNYGGEIDYPNSKSWYVQDPSGHEIEVSYTLSGKMQFPPKPVL